MKFTPRGNLIVLEVASTSKFTKKGIMLPDGKFNFDSTKPMKIVEVGKEVVEYKVGDVVILDAVNPNQFKLPNDERVLILISEHDIAGKWEE